MENDLLLLIRFGEKSHGGKTALHDRMEQVQLLTIVRVAACLSPR